MKRISMFLDSEVNVGNIYLLVSRDKRVEYMKVVENYSSSMFWGEVYTNTFLTRKRYLFFKNYLCYNVWLLEEQDLIKV